ncbi:hypothetical protein [Xanthomonas theicola]|uniref:hypothetical protein n=1 Tax=Xanthomonas theicola TaxID=56464 RepID=UPI0036D81D0C
MALAAGAATADARGEQPVHVPAGLSITSPRLCAALVVYRMASADDWGLRTTLAQTALNAFAAAGGPPDCAAPVTAALSHQFDPRRWQAALDAVDAVRSGDYTPSPAACARANAVVAADDSSPEWLPGEEELCAALRDLATAAEFNAPYGRALNRDVIATGKPIDEQRAAMDRAKAPKTHPYRRHHPAPKAVAAHHARAERVVPEHARLVKL